MERASSRLLIDEAPLQVLPSLAKAIGLNEAIVLQQLHYWLKTSAHDHDGKAWVYNSYEQWQAQFPFWSERTIRRTIKELETRELLITANFNTHAFDKTKWYTINYAALTALDDMARLATSCGQPGQTKRTTWPDEKANQATPVLNECACVLDLGTEITTETTNREGERACAPPPQPPTALVMPTTPKKAKAPKPPRTLSSLPEAGFQVTDAMRTWAAENVPSITLAFEAEKFCDYYRATGKTMKDWDAAFRNWLRRAPAMTPVHMNGKAPPLTPEAAKRRRHELGRARAAARGEPYGDEEDTP